MKRWSMYHRLVGYMSIADLIASIGMAFGPSLSNGALCSIQAVGLQINAAVPLFNTLIIAYMWLMVTGRMTPASLQFGTRILVVFIFSFAILSAIVPVFMDVYQPSELWCWVRPGTTWIYLFYAPVIFAMVIAGTLASLLICHVMKTKQALSKSSDGNSLTGDTFLQRRALSQSLFKSKLFVVVLFSVYSPAAINRLVELFNPDSSNETFLLLEAFTLPLQGCLNAVVYFSPRIYLACCSQRGSAFAMSRRLDSSLQRDPSTIQHDLTFSIDDNLEDDAISMTPMSASDSPFSGIDQDTRRSTGAFDASDVSQHDPSRHIPAI